MKYNISEIFGPTIQGEGPNAGMKCIFVRVVGCDFNCSWCDSKFSWSMKDTFKSYTEQELLNEILQYCESTNTASVIFTGGNPCLYDFGNIINELHNQHITADVETQGSRLPNWLYNIDQLVISPKGPSSNQPDVFDNVKDFLTNEEMLPTNYNAAIKIPIFNEQDLDFASKYYDLVQAVKIEFGINIRMYLSVGNTDTSEEGDISRRVLNDYEKLINRINESDMSKVYILPQIHTLIWGNKQGV